MIDQEYIRKLRAKNVWLELTQRRRQEMRERFIENLAISYHAAFFNQLTDDKIIEEIWFNQFVEAETSHLF